MICVGRAPVLARRGVHVRFLFEDDLDSEERVSKGKVSVGEREKLKLSDSLSTCCQLR